MRSTSGKNGTVMVFRSNVPFMGIRCNIAGLSEVWVRGAPFCVVCEVPLCCEGTIGAGVCRAVMADVADGPGPAEAMDCGRAVDIPDTGSVLDGGHNPRGPFLRAQAAASPAGAGVAPLVWGVSAGTMVLAEADDAREDEEFARWRFLRGMNIL